MWKFYVKVVENGAQVDALTCKEVDLNYDGPQGRVVLLRRRRGNLAHEEFDLDFDGKVDMWTFRQQGKIVRQEMDTNYDGRTDVWKFYENEKLARIERSSKSQRPRGRVGVAYEGGKLDRIGYDIARQTAASIAGMRARGNAGQPGSARRPAQRPPLGHRPPRRSAGRTDGRRSPRRTPRPPPRRRK